MVKKPDNDGPMRVTALGEITLLLTGKVNLQRDRTLRQSIQAAIVKEVRAVHGPLVAAMEYVRDELLEYPPTTLEGDCHTLARCLTDCLEEYGAK